VSKSSIEWTDETWMVDRGGRRTRVYLRLCPDRPGQQLRRAMAAKGLRWCRECRAWLRADTVTRSGLCNDHERAAYRAMYAANRDRIKAAKLARKRGVDPVPAIAAEVLLEQFAGRCAYCPAPATTWDHIVPVSLGGLTEPGNIVPACGSCNSSKNARPLDEWAPGRDLSDALADVLALAVAA
jgi:5-methylcytosine-specific restriction endonuclease McrA